MNKYFTAYSFELRGKLHNGNGYFEAEKLSKDVIEREREAVKREMMKYYLADDTEVFVAFQQFIKLDD